MTVVPVRSPRLHRPDLLEVAVGDAEAEALPPQVAAVLDLDDQAARERVDHRDADAVQAAGDLVAAAAELAAGVQHGQRHRDGGHAPGRARCRSGCRGRCPRPGCRRRPAASPRSGRSSRPAPRRPRCRRSPRSGGAGRAHRWSRCTCRGACARPRGPRGPGSRRRRSRRASAAVAVLDRRSARPGSSTGSSADCSSVRRTSSGWCPHGRGRTGRGHDEGRGDQRPVDPTSMIPLGGPQSTLPPPGERDLWSEIAAAAAPERRP